MENKNWQDEAIKESGIKVPEWELEGAEQKETMEVSKEAEPSAAEKRLEEIAAEAKEIPPENPEQKAAQVETMRAEIAALHDEAIKINKTKDFERENNVNQDIIAQSYLAHVDIYNQLSEKSTKAMNHYFLLEKSNGENHPSVIEAKREWFDAVAEKDKEYSIMSPMVENLTPETFKKYRKDFELHGAVDTSFFPKNLEEETTVMENTAEETQKQETKKSEPYSPSFENTDNLAEEIKNENTIREVYDFNSLMNAIDKVGDITGSDGYVYEPDYLKDVISEVFMGRKQLSYVTGTFGLRDKVSELLEKQKSEMILREEGEMEKQSKSPEQKLKDEIYELEGLQGLYTYKGETEKAAKIEEQIKGKISAIRQLRSTT